MKIPVGWLKQWVNPDLDHEALATMLTMAGLEVEAIEPFGTLTYGHESAKKVVIAEVLEVSPHPQADRLRVCQVRPHIKAMPVTVVCGAPNVRVGLKVALALPDAVLSGKTLTISSLRGIDSHGMLLSAAELGINSSEADAKGLLELPQDAPVGMPLVEYWPVSDMVFTIKLTPNRGDCLSIIGLAREVCALTNTPIKDLEDLSSHADFADPVVTHHKGFEINLDSEGLCPYYAGQLLMNINKADSQSAKPQTPWWMKIRLLQCGQRSISPLVDITNFVMLETGQPLHAFDADKLLGPIGVRLARPNESLKLLNGETATLKTNLKTNFLLITDKDVPVALAGLMGGDSTAVTESTASVFFEAAHFIPTAIQNRAKHIGITSEAAYRFERGVNPQMPKLALNRAMQLAHGILGGQVGTRCEANNKTFCFVDKKVLLRQSRAEQLIGIAYSQASIETALKTLGFRYTVISSTAATPDLHYEVVVPAWRFDVSIEEDIVEEVARIVGYDAVPESLPKASVAINVDVDALEKHEPNPWDTAQKLAHHGYLETHHFGFVSDAQEDKFAHPTCFSALSVKAQDQSPPTYQSIALANPIAENLSVMRSQLWGSLVESLAQHTRHSKAGLRLFELARVFQKLPMAAGSAKDQLRDKPHEYPHTVQGMQGLYHQPFHLAMLQWGSVQPEQWAVPAPARLVDFFDLKGDIQNLFPSLNSVACHFIKPEEGAFHKALHPSRSAKILMSDANHQSAHIGWIGELHPRWVAHYNLPSAPMIMECLFEPLLPKTRLAYEPIVRLPIVERDLSLLMPASVAVGDLRDSLLKQSWPLLQAVSVFDVYTGIAQVTNGEASHTGEALQLRSEQKSVALRFQLQHKGSNADTLSEEQIAQQMAQITAFLAKQWSAHVRTADIIKAIAE